mmetsp:Transcript_2033/g.6360  ORF Transcript_2033/g.6360 Transcript_2033/m.6360 type:complete len:281 (+) Transcript_2033:1096-1938(+)
MRREGQQQGRDGKRTQRREGCSLICKGQFGQKLLALEEPACALLKSHFVQWGAIDTFNSESLFGALVVRLVLHGQVEEGRNAERLYVSHVISQTFNMPTEGLLAVVKAGIELQVRANAARRLIRERGGSVDGAHGDLLVLLFECLEDVEVLAFVGQAAGVLERLHLGSHTKARAFTTAAGGHLAEELRQGLNVRLPPLLQSERFNGRHRDDGLHCHKLGQAHRDRDALTISELYRPLVLALLHALEHASPAGVVEEHRARRGDPQRGIGLHLLQVLLDQL